MDDDFTGKGQVVVGVSIQYRIQSFYAPNFAYSLLRENYKKEQYNTQRKRERERERESERAKERAREKARQRQRQRHNIEYDRSTPRILI